MKIVKLKGHKIEFYESVDEMKITEFHSFNKYLLIDSGIGSDIQSIDDHLSRLYRYINEDKKNEGLQEINNMRQNLAFVISGVSPVHLSTACLIHSIDGEILTDRSETNLQAILKQLSKWGMTKGDNEKINDEIKKKSRMN